MKAYVRTYQNLPDREPNLKQQDQDTHRLKQCLILRTAKLNHTLIRRELANIPISLHCTSRTQVKPCRMMYP